MRRFPDPWFKTKHHKRRTQLLASVDKDFQKLHGEMSQARDKNRKRLEARLAKKDARTAARA